MTVVPTISCDAVAQATASRSTESCRLHSRGNDIFLWLRSREEDRNTLELRYFSSPSFASLGKLSSLAYCIVSFDYLPLIGEKNRTFTFLILYIPYVSFSIVRRLSLCIFLCIALSDFNPRFSGLGPLALRSDL